MQNDEHYIPSVHSALRVLELLAKDDYKESTLTQISSALSISKTTCLRILKTLQRQDFVNYEENSKRYSLGAYLIALGNRASEVNDIIGSIVSLLPRVCSLIGHTIVLVKPTGVNHLMYIAKEEPSDKVRLTISVGDTFPIIAAALGKCFMANMPQSEALNIISEMVKGEQLPSFTEHTETSLTKYLSDLEEIRRNGIAESHEEYSPGITALACPIFNGKGEIILAIGVFLSSSLVHQMDLDPIKEMLKSSASDITKTVSRFE